MCNDIELNSPTKVFHVKVAVTIISQIIWHVAEYKKSTCKALSMMDLDKINYDLILELLEWIVDGDHQVRFITKVLISVVHNYNSRMKTCTWYVILENLN